MRRSGHSAQYGWRVGVVIPARDEESFIDSCLRATLQSLDASVVAETWVVVVADSCRDTTVERARAGLRDRGVVLECEARSVGVARRLGVNAILERFASASPSAVWIANTDADSQPTLDWITRQLCLAAQGYCAVAGIVRVQEIDSLAPELLTAVLDEYVVNVDGTHPHVHGANLGIRADAYLDAGGWSSRSLAEDHCLWSRVRARQWSVVASASSVVSTSGRLMGRAAGGFADTLRHRLELLYA